MKNKLYTVKMQSLFNAKTFLIKERIKLQEKEKHLTNSIDLYTKRIEKLHKKMS